MSRLEEIRARLAASSRWRAGDFSPAQADPEWQLKKHLNIDLVRHTPDDIAYLLSALDRMRAALQWIAEQPNRFGIGADFVELAHKECWSVAQACLSEIRAKESP